MDLWIGVAVAGAIGFGLGAAAVYWMSRKRTGGTSVAALKQEHEQFREQVSEHFVETARLINRLTDSYKDVFDHLSQGAETLVDDATLRERMPQVSDQEVRLKRLGAPAARSAPASSSTNSAQAKSSTAGTPKSPGAGGSATPGSGASGPDAPRAPSSDSPKRTSPKP